MDKSILRILDANANRAREALRVLEDIARFSLDHATLTESLKHLRHDLTAVLALLPMADALQARDTPHDIGTEIKTESEFARASRSQIAAANAKRLSEALRSMEECAKTKDADAARRLEQLRYRGYDIERTLINVLQQQDATARFNNVRLYVLLTEAMCERNGGWENVLDQVLAAGRESAIEGSSPVCIQLREKNLPDADLLTRARAVVQKCHAAGALAIINDRPDIAQIAEADGVHLGQTDLPCAEIRKWMSSRLIIGVSTENLEQARAAVAAGATYVAVGPMFTTPTKHKPRIAGPAYAAQAIASFTLPVVAIGGITPENVGQVTAAGIQIVAVSAAVLLSSDPAGAVRTFLHALTHPLADSPRNP